MSNETPQDDGEPTQSAPAAPAAEDKPFTYDDAVKSAGDEDDVVEAPPIEAPPTVAVPAAPTAAPAAAAPAPATTDRPAGIFVPKWVGIVVAGIVAALVFGGIGYAIGDSSGDSNSRNASNSFPGAVNGDGPFANGNGPGNGQRQLPGNGGGSGGQTSGNTAFLGVALADASNGVGISDVQSGSPAADAGLKAGDLVTAVDGTNVTSPAALAAAIHQHSSGDQITITYTRNGTSSTAKVTLGSQSSTQSS